MNTVYLSIGSNIEPERNFVKCAAALDRLFHSSAWSPIYQSKPVGMLGPDFLNAAVRVTTALDLNTVNRQLKELELSQGRDTHSHSFSNRTLDVDLLLFNDLCISTPTLKIPRPELVAMGFVLVPMVDLSPELEHPAIHKKLQCLLRELQLSDPDQINSLSKIDLTL